MTHVSNLLRLVTVLEEGGAARVTERGGDRDRQKSDSRKRADMVGGVGGDRRGREQDIKKKKKQESEGGEGEAVGGGAGDRSQRGKVEGSWRWTV